MLADLVAAKPFAIAEIARDSAPASLFSSRAPASARLSAAACIWVCRLMRREAVEGEQREPNQNRQHDRDIGDHKAARCRGHAAGAGRFARSWPSSASRMSLQTQAMQAAADSLALHPGARAPKEAGAESRAISAMANGFAATKSANTLVGVGSSPTLQLHLRLLFHLVGREPRDRRHGGARGVQCQIRGGQDKGVGFGQPFFPASFLSQELDQRILSRRRGGRRFCRNDSVFRCADLRLQPLQSQVQVR